MLIDAMGDYFARGWSPEVVAKAPVYSSAWRAPCHGPLLPGRGPLPGLRLRCALRLGSPGTGGKRLHVTSGPGHPPEGQRASLWSGIMAAWRQCSCARLRSSSGSWVLRLKSWSIRYALRILPHPSPTAKIHLIF